MTSKKKSEHRKLLYQKLANRWFVFTEDEEVPERLLYGKLPSHKSPAKDEVEVVEVVEKSEHPAQLFLDSDDVNVTSS